MTAQFDYQGFDVFSNGTNLLASASATAGFQQIAAVGSNSVGITPKLFVDTGSSSQLVTDPTYSTSDASLIAGIQAAEAQGLKVLLEPHIEGLDGTGSDALAPTDTAAFFASYKTQIVHLATIAQQTGVDTFSIGNEMSSLSGSAYRAQWLDIIAAVRQVYSGKITYEAATTEASSVSFWDKVDTIGYNAYLTLSSSTTPTVAQLEQAWTTTPADNYTAAALGNQSIVAFMQSLSTTYNKPVLITEVGYRSIVGAAINPGNWTATGTADTTGQTNAYQALFQVLSAQGGSWLAGLELLEYNIDGTATSTDYSVQNKPAMALVQQYFTGTATVAGQTINGSAISDLIDVGAGNDVINAGLGNDIIKVGSGNDTINAGPDTIALLKTTTVTITGYGAGGQVALLINGKQVGGTVTFTPASDTSGYQTYTFTFTNPGAITSMDVSLLNASSGGNAMIRGITINGAALATTDITNASAPGTFNLYNQPLHLDATNYQDWFYGAQSDDDLIYAGTGNDTIDGGAGIDTVVFQGASSSYTLSRSGNALIVTAANGVTDTLTNVEYLQFSDGAVAVASLKVANQGSSLVTSLMSPLLSQATVSGASGVGVARVALVEATQVQSGSAAQIAVSGMSAAGATVTLLNGVAALASTTADASGAYSFTLSNVAAGVYALSTQAALGSLSSAASNGAVIVVGSSQTVASLIMMAPSTPGAIYVTDPTNPVAVTTVQLQAISAMLSQVVTPITLAVTDTAANIVASIDLIGTQTNLASITLTDTHVLAVSLSTMKTLIANDAAILAKIQGGYSFAVSAATSATTVASTFYDSTGTVTSTQTATTVNGVTETYIRNADGTTSDTFTNAAGVKTSQSISNTAGKQVTVWGIAGKPYTTQAYVYDTTGKLVSLTNTDASGRPVSIQTVAANGAVTLNSYTNGVLGQTVVTNPDGSTDTKTFNAAGALVTDYQRHADGTRDQYDYEITGKPYTSDHMVMNSAGVGTELLRYTATGAIYTDQTAANGVVTLDSYTNGVRTQRLITNTDGSTDTQTFNAAGALVTDYQRHANGSADEYDYGITGKPYTSDHMVMNSAGVGTELVRYTATGVIYTDQTALANGTVTLDSYTNGIRTQRLITNTDGSTDTQSFNAAGTMTTDFQRHANGTRDQYDYGITGQAYTSDHLVYNSAAAVTEVVKYTANGQILTDQTNGSNGTVTLDSYTNGVKSQELVTNTDGSTDTKTYNTSGTLVTDYVKHADNSRDQYDYAITGKSYTADHLIYNTAGAATDVIKFNTDGTTTNTAYASGITLTGTTGNDTFTSFGGDQFAFTGQIGADTINNFKVASDVISISKTLASSFATLPLTQSGANTKLVFDQHNSITLTGINASALTAHNFTFV